MGYCFLLELKTETPYIKVNTPPSPWSCRSYYLLITPTILCKQVCKDCEKECRKHEEHIECKACADACAALVDQINLTLK